MDDAGHGMDDSALRAEQLLTLSSGARRLGELVAAAQTPLRYEVMRHLLRVSEETMTETLEEAVAVRLLRRGAGPHTYVPYDDATGAAILDGIPEERRLRMRAQIEGAAKRVFGDGT